MGGATLGWSVLAGLLVLSALFSGSETALFSLSPAERRDAGGKVQRLMAEPQRLLVSILVSNLIVNILVFAVAGRLHPVQGPYGDFLSGLLAVVAVVLFGEVLPKTVALRARMRVARLGALPLSVLVAALRPAQGAAERALEVVYRVLGEAGSVEQVISAETLGAVLEHSASQGLLLESEAEFLAGVAELSEVRVREIMTPRVDMLMIDVDEPASHAEVVQRALEARSHWLIVIDDDPDHVLGMVRVRDMLLHPGSDPRERLEPTQFVPEVARVLDLLEFLRERKRATAVVVDEWGGTAGLVRIEDVLEEVVGELRAEGEQPEPSVVRLERGRFLVPGGLSVRDWNELFGKKVVANEFETVGGFVTALLGSIPCTGDRIEAGGLSFKVAEARRRRILSVEISVAGSPAAAEGAA